MEELLIEKDYLMSISLYLAYICKIWIVWMFMQIEIFMNTEMEVKWRSSSSFKYGRNMRVRWQYGIILRN